MGQRKREDTYSDAMITVNSTTSPPSLQCRKNEKSLPAPKCVSPLGPWTRQQRQRSRHHVFFMRVRIRLDILSIHPSMIKWADVRIAHAMITVNPTTSPSLQGPERMRKVCL
jgi:hypothetical protein